MNERISKLKGKRELLIEQRQTYLGKYEHTASNIQVAERAKPYFVTLKEATDQDAVTLYSELLTSIVHDVMLDHDQQVVLSTSVVRNKTALEIKTIKNGKVEYIDDGRGGSISNLISAGLRFIALYKSSNRRFVMLDEPECWLAPDLIPSFVSVIERMSDMIGIQTVLISHHASDVISSDKSEVITIAHDKSNKIVALKSSKLVADLNQSISVGNTPMVDEHYSELSSTSNIGIDYIRLVNIQSHTDTVIELGKGLTVINGQNDIGKSVIARSFAAMLSNDFKDNLIQHDQECAALEVMTEQGVVKWSFKLGSKTSLYQFIVNDEIIHERDAKRGELPEFVNEVLSMQHINGLNVHIADQRDPLFILHPSHSPAERAEMLSMGDSFKQLQIMMQLHDERLRENRKSLKDIKEHIDDVNDKLFYLSSIDLVDELNTDAAAAQVIEPEQYSSLISTLEHQNVVKTHATALKLMEALCVETEEDKSHDDLLAVLESEATINASVIQTLNTLVANVDLIQTYDDHGALLQTLEKAELSDQSNVIERVSECLYNISFINTRPVPDFDAEGLSKKLDQQIEHEKEIDALKRELETLLELSKKYTVCPTCGQNVGYDHDGHDFDVDVVFSGVEKDIPQSTSNRFQAYF